MQQLFVAGDEPVPGYRLIDEIEGSAFYKVWRVQTPEGGCRWWKIIDLVVGNAAIETRTLGLLVKLRHPHLNTLTNFWNLDDGKTLIIESDVPVRSLRDLLNRRADQNSGVPKNEVLPLIDQAAQGLDFLNKPQHEYNGQLVAIYHRSLRPDCLLLFEENDSLVCKVSDFGLSKPVTDEAAQHSQGLLHYDYDPPEFFEGQTAPTSDQYALAVNYYELRTGKMPFRGTMLEQLQARLNDKPDLSYIEEPERSIVRKALHRDPTRRFKSCSDFVRHLKEDRVPEGMGKSAAAPEAASIAGNVGRMNNPSLSGITAPRPSAPASTSPAWRSTSAAAVQPKSPRPEPSDSAVQPMVFQAPSARNAAALQAQRQLNGREEPGDTSNILAQQGSDTATTHRSPVKVQRKPVPSAANLRSIREHIGAAGNTFTDSYTGERRIPMIWVVVILSATALGSVWLASIMG